MMFLINFILHKRVTILNKKMRRDEEFRAFCTFLDDTAAIFQIKFGEFWEEIMDFHISRC